MKALWIRVEAHDVESREIGRFAAALRVSRVVALGHSTALAGAIAEHTDDGDLEDLEDDEIEQWARWDGTPGELAAAVRAHLQAEDGTFRDWTVTMGLLVEKREKDRRRKEKERKKKERVRGQSTDNPRTGRGKSTVTERNGTGRNGTGDSSSSSLVTKERALNPGEQPALLSQLSTEELLERLPEIARRFFTVFYADAIPRRRHDVALQLATLAAGERVTYRKQTVCAYDAERLDLKCLEILEADNVEKPDSAIAYLFVALNDTTDVQEKWAHEEKAKYAGPIQDDRVTNLILGVTEARSMPGNPLQRSRAHR